MGILSFLPVIGKIVDKGLGIIDDLVEDKDLANKLKVEIQKQILIQNHEENVKLIEAQMKIILAESTGSWLQRNWRPVLMIVIIFIVANNYVLFPYLSAWTDKVQVLELPKGMWALLNIGVGGYIAGRSAEKIVLKNKN